MLVKQENNKMKIISKNSKKPNPVNFTNGHLYRKYSGHPHHIYFCCTGMLMCLSTGKTAYQKTCLDNTLWEDVTDQFSLIENTLYENNS